MASTSGKDKMKRVPEEVGAVDTATKQQAPRTAQEPALRRELGMGKTTALWQAADEQLAAMGADPPDGGLTPHGEDPVRMEPGRPGG